MRILNISLLSFILSISTLNAEVLPPKPGKRLIIHTVKKGEELYLLAGYYLLNARGQYVIYNWNSDVIRNQNRIFPGQELMIHVDNDWQPPYNLDEYIKSLVTQ